MTQVSEALAFLDVIVSLSHFASSGSYVRPNFGQSLNVRQGRHPLLERRHREETVPNDISLNSSKNFLLLMGRESRTVKLRYRLTRQRLICGI